MDEANKIDKKMAMKNTPKAIGISREDLVTRLPRGTSHKVTDSLIDTIANIEEDIDLDQGLMEEQVLSSLHLLGQGIQGLTLQKYVNAVKFVNLKKFMSNKEAWSIIFREKYDSLVADGKPVDNFVSMFNNSDTVVELDKKAIIPTHIEYSHLRHEMTMNLAQLARGQSTSGKDVTPLVQCQAASKLLDALTVPVDSVIDLKIGMSDEAKSVQEGLTEQLRRMADSQIKRLEAGESIQDVQKLDINIEMCTIDVEVE